MLAETPRPPYYAVIFSSTRTDIDNGYEVTADRMVELAKGVGYTLHGKTGAGPIVPNNFDGEFGGWLVGWVNYGDSAPVVYALYVRGPNYSSVASFRQEMSTEFLEAIGALPQNAPQ